VSKTTSTTTTTTTNDDWGPGYVFFQLFFSLLLLQLELGLGLRNGNHTTMNSLNYHTLTHHITSPYWIKAYNGRLQRDDPRGTTSGFFFTYYDLFTRGTTFLQVFFSYLNTFFFKNTNHGHQRPSMTKAEVFTRYARAFFFIFTSSNYFLFQEQTP
jgi:hypothetical protein